MMSPVPPDFEPKNESNKPVENKHSHHNHQPWFPVSLLETYSLDASLVKKQTVLKEDTQGAELKFVQKLTKIASLDINLLLSGETGTGKTCLAHLLHVNSQRAYQPFVEINCAAIPEMLLESELFGAAKGAHSSAFTAVQGKIAAAEGGTLFLDEVNLMSQEMQAKLLQFLNDGHYYPLGSSEVCKADIRLICAANSCLETATNDGTFREDLYHRISTYPVQLRPLRERKEDLIQIALASCQSAITKHKLPQMGMSSQSLLAISSYTWPGNLRELNNTILRACIEAAMDESTSIERHHLGIASLPPKRERRAKQLLTAENTTEDLKTATQTFQRAYIEKCLNENEWNVSHTARVLGLSRGHLHTLMNSLEIDRDVTTKIGEQSSTRKTQNSQESKAATEKRRRAEDGNIVEFRRNSN